jgi:hypothetical protein
MDKCEVCSAQVRELRRGRCWGCYSRWVSSRPIGLGASCRLCGERRRSYLRSIELLGSWAPACHACAERLAQLHPMPRSLAALREALRRERRQHERRTSVAEEADAIVERRAAERRRSARVAGGSSSAIPHPDEVCLDDDVTAPIVDEEMVLEIAELAIELESLAEDLGEVADLTRIHDFSR